MKPAGLNRLALRSGSSYMLSNIVISSLSIITAPIFTRLLTTSDYGIATNFAAWINVGLVVIGLGLAYSIGNAKTDFPLELDNFLAAIQTLGTLFAGVVLVIAILFKAQLAQWMEIDQNLVIVLFVYLLFFPSVIFSQERYKFLLKYKPNIYITLFGAVGSVLFCLGFILFIFKEQRYYGRILGLILPFFLMGIFFYVSIIRKGWNWNFKKYWKYALRISLPMIPHALAMVVLTQMDRIMIVRMVGNSAAGLFSFGYTYAVLLLLVSNAVLQAYQPWLYFKYKDNNLSVIKTSTNFIAIGMCLLTMLSISFAPEALMILGAKEFWPSKVVVMPIAVGALFQYLYNTYATLELYHKKTIVVAMGTLLAAGINYTLNRFLIPVFGYPAAGYATLASYFCLALFHFIAYQKVTGKRVFDDRFIWMAVLGTMMYSFLISLLYHVYLLRYLLVIGAFCIISGVAYLNRKRIVHAYQLMSDKNE